MTEAEWVVYNDPEAMLKLLEANSTDRKLRLFACACCYRVWELVSDERGREAITTAERFADGLVDAVKLRLAETGAESVLQEPADTHSGYSAALAGATATAKRMKDVRPWRACASARGFFEVEHQGMTIDDHPEFFPRAREAEAKEYVQQAILLREIFGNPFRPVAVDPAWLTSTVVALARGIYEERAFDRMPILADALQEAGCDSEDVLDHCRGPGPHVRGCWVVDLVLGKE
jgi:hypothetical protein